MTDSNAEDDLLIAGRKPSGTQLAASITRAASKQTYYTIRFLVDRDRVTDAYRAYSYFRWVDDWLDEEGREKSERLAFVRRQAALIDACYRGERPAPLADQELLLLDLVSGNLRYDRGLEAYIYNMMALLAFDAERKGRLISSHELNDYTRWLATSVTEAMHTFIGHYCKSPQDNTRYLAVTAAHITHMLRDTLEDVDNGYFNIPKETLSAARIQPDDVDSDAYRNWVKNRVQLAQHYFKLGAGYMRKVESPRCRLAGYAYMARFNGVLATIQRDGYRLRRAYPSATMIREGKLSWWVLSQTLWGRPIKDLEGASQTR